MSKIRKKTGALVLAAALILSCIPFGAERVQAQDRTVEANKTWKLEADEVVNGSVNMKAGSKIDLNGHTLTVKGDFNQPEGELYIGEGTLKITGRYYSRYGSGSGNGYLTMIKDKGVMDVDGDVVIDSNKYAGSIGSGTLRIGGNFSVSDPKTNSTDGNGYPAYGSHKTEFKGSGVHVVDFAQSSNGNHMQNVSVTGGGSVLLKNYTDGFTLAADVKLAGGSTINGDRTLKINGHTLTVDGNFEQQGSTKVDLSDVDGADSKMVVKGDYLHRSGELYIGEGTLNIGGKYYSRYGSKSGDGYLTMIKDKGVMDVDGDVVIDSNKYAGSIGSGTLRIGGGLSVSDPKTDSTDGNGYSAYGSHVTEFKGAVIHEVSFGESGGNHMNYVSVTGGGSLHTKDYTEGFTLVSDGKLADGSSINGSRTLKINGHTLTVEGDFSQDGTTKVDLSDVTDAGGKLQESKMVVTGEYAHHGGELYIGEGRLNIGGRYYSRYGSKSGDGYLTMIKDKGVMDVDGDVVIDSNKYAGSIGSGTLRIGGGLSVSDPNTNSTDGNGYSAYGSHVTEFKGKKTHKVDFASGGNHMCNVSVTDGGSLKLENYADGFTLVSDAKLADGSVLNGSRTLKINGHTLTATGSFTQEGTTKIDLSSVTDADGKTMQSKMVVSGEYAHHGGELFIGEGTLNIGGRYYSRYGSKSGDGYLTMIKDKGVMDVDGDVVIDSNKYAGSIGSGILRIGGNLSVSDPKTNSTDGNGYPAYGSHVTEFKGGVKHTVNFSNKSNKINKLKLGIGDSVNFTGALNGIEKGTDPQITVKDTSVASVSSLTIKGLKEGETTAAFKSSDGSVNTTVLVGKKNTARLEPLPDEPGGEVEPDAIDLSGAEITLSGDSFAYTGSAIQPAATVVVDGVTLTLGTDYKVNYSNNVNAGTATVTITGKGNYTGTAVTTFTITKQNTSGGQDNGNTSGGQESVASDLSKAKLVLSGQSFYYTGSAIKPTVKVYLNGYLVTAGYTITYSNNVNVGTATVTVTGKGSYIGSAKATFTIKAAPAEKEEIPEIVDDDDDDEITVPKPSNLVLKALSGKKIKVTWKKTSVVTGYQVQLSMAKNFNKVAAKKDTKKLKCTVKKLKAKKKYFVRVRAYKKVNGKTYYSGWIKKGVKTKK